MSAQYATILTEEADNLRIRYIANKHIFQNFNPSASYNPAYLSNIIDIQNNYSVMTVTNNWVGVGVTNFTSTDNSFQVNNRSGNTQFVVGSTGVGINTSTVAGSLATLNVYGTGYFADSVGIGTNIANEKLRVDGNVQAFLFRARGADYAEWERLDESIQEIPSDGSVVGFNSEGNIVTRYSASVHFGVVSHKPSLIGNEKLLEEIEKEKCLPIVYLGKVEMTLEGDVAVGDYLLPCVQEGDTIGVRTISSGQITFSEYTRIVGYVHRRISDSLYEVIVRI